MTKALTLYHLYVSRVAATLAIICAVSVFLYGTFLLMAVAHATHMTSAQEQIKDLTGKLSEAESQYLSATNAISLATATNMGLVKPASIAIVTTAQTAALTFNR
ncbi:MAG TPA: hypothetical protein VIY48_14485 [Candidatus Paceibacterota bacterium]